MSDREAAIAGFLATTPWAGRTRCPLAGDASGRRYERLADPVAGTTVVLMNADPATGEDVRPFMAIARHLSALGLSAPQVLAAAPESGLLLLEDLGDALFARLLVREPGRAAELYAAAADVLVAVQDAAAPEGLLQLGPAELAQMAAPAYDWYARGALGMTPAGRDRFLAEMETVLGTSVGHGTALALRDYHAENLIWLPARVGVARVGLLDFQDAFLGHPAYDLVSLLTDARREVPEALAEKTRAHFLTRTGHEPAPFHAAYAVLGAQRNLRILGVFARLSLHLGKPHYVDLIPRVWGHAMRCLAHSALAGVARRVEADLPPPEPALLARLKERCATAPTP